MRSPKCTFYLKTFVIILSVLTAIKILITGYDIDEQYAIAMSYRLLKGDFPFYDMWEPHQTSGYLLTLIMLPYMWLFNTTGIVLYSRIFGLLIHTLVFSLLYREFIHYLDKDYSLLVCGIGFFSLPKLMFLPEFSNLQIWFLLLICICLLRYFGAVSLKQQRGNLSYLVLAGVFTALEVLTYPSMILVFFSCIALFIINQSGSLKKELIAYISPCLLLGILFVGILIMNISPSLLFSLLGIIASDGSHSASLAAKLGQHLQSLATLGKFFVLYGGLSSIATVLLKRIHPDKNQLPTHLWCRLFLVATLLGQGVIWVFGKQYPNYPSAEYFFIPCLFLVCFVFRKRKRCPISDIMIFIPLTAFVGIILFSNHPLLVSLPFLAPCILGILALPGMDPSPDRICVTPLATRLLHPKTLLLLWLLVILFGKCFLLRTTGGQHYSFRQPVQLITQGPAAGIIADAKTVSHYNSSLEAATACIPKGSKVFYAGCSSDVYLMNDLEVCSPSTISSPTFNELIDTYFALHPNKKPEYVIRDSQLPQVNDWLLSFIYENCEEDTIYYDSNIMVYKAKP